jgi:hypothetical protein
MYFSLKMVPVQIETLGQFTAPNPWNGNAREKWTLNIYELISETFAPGLHWKNLRAQQAQTADVASRRAGAQSGKLKMRRTIGFESSDGRKHMLPRMLIDLWWAGEVPDDALPALLRQFEPTLKRSDFKIRRRRLVFKVEAILLLVIGIAALTALLIDRVSVNPAHREIQTTQVAWLARPMSEQTISAAGDGAKVDACVRLRSGQVQAPSGLETYGNSDLLCWFNAQNEIRLAIVDGREFRIRAGVPDPKINLHGVVLPASKLGLSAQWMELLAQKIPRLNKDFVFVYNADWDDRGGALHLADDAPLLGSVGLCLMLPFVAFLISSRFWRRHDAQLKERFRNALAQPGFGGTFGVPGLNTQGSAFQSS